MRADFTGKRRVHGVGTCSRPTEHRFVLANYERIVGKRRRRSERRGNGRKSASYSRLSRVHNGKAACFESSLLSIKVDQLVIRDRACKK